VFELVFLCRVERNFVKINKKSSTAFEKKKEKERREKYFYKIKI